METSGSLRSLPTSKLTSCIDKLSDITASGSPGPGPDLQHWFCTEDDKLAVLQGQLYVVDKKGKML